MNQMNIEMNSNTNCMSPSWWHRRTKLEKILCFVTITSFVIIGITLAFLGSKYRKNSKLNDEATVCMTPGCVISAAEVLQSLDETIDPCDNFYKFACGGWMDKHTISDHKTEVTTFDDVRDELNLQLKALLEKPLDGSESKSIKIVKDIYYSCMNQDNIEKAGAQPLQKVLNTLGGWPVVLGDAWDGSKFDWMESVFTLRKFGFIGLFLTMGVSVDLKNNAVNVINLDQSSLGMPDRSYYINGLADPITKAYINLMLKSAEKLGASRQRAEKELMEVFNFETTLAKYSSPAEEMRDINSRYNKLTLPQLQELVPQIDWFKYLNGLLNDAIAENETVIVYAKEYLGKVGELISKTDNRVLANFMMWRTVVASIPFLSKEWKALAQEYSSAITGQSVEEPLWEQCLSFSNFGLAMSSYYVKQYFKSDSKQKATEMVKYIKTEFLSILDQIDWMDKETKKHAKEKAEAMTTYIGYPQELLNDSLVDQTYDNLTVIKDDFFGNYLNIRKWFIAEANSKLRKPNVKGEWKNHADAAVINAFYNPMENSIEFPAGILQKVFFNRDRQNYMNFGAIGFIIGHEITHGFDDRGKQFDKNGNNRNWWQNVTDERFKEKAQCIINQYSNYTTELGQQLNGINTQGENIADNGGLKQAYLAYHSWVRDNGEEKKLPGLKYTPAQLFFISAANIWCGKFRPEAMKLMVLTDEHSPSEFRVIGPMSNSNEFSTAFGCSLGSKMNSEKKCRVW